MIWLHGANNETVKIEGAHKPGMSNFCILEPGEEIIGIYGNKSAHVKLIGGIGFIVCRV